MAAGPFGQNGLSVPYHVGQDLGKGLGRVIIHNLNLVELNALETQQKHNSVLLILALVNNTTQYNVKC